MCVCICVYACMSYRNVPFPRRLYTILRKKNHAYVPAGSWWPTVNFLIPLVSKNRCTGSTELSSLHNVLLRIMRFVPTSTSVACYCVQDSRCVCFFLFLCENSYFVESRSTLLVVLFHMTRDKATGKYFFSFWRLNDIWLAWNFIGNSTY